MRVTNPTVEGDPRTFRVLVSDVFRDQQMSHVTRINEKRLVQIQPLANDGRNNNGMFKAQFERSTVVIKVLPDKPNHFRQMNEGQWLFLLNKLNLGPKLLGLTSISGRIAVVEEYIEGVDERTEPSTWGKFKVTRAMVSDMRRAAKTLDELNIMANDLQFRFSSDGRAILIDPEWFYSKDLGEPLERTESAQSKVEEILSYLKHVRRI